MAGTAPKVVQDEAVVAAAVANLPRPLVFTNGCFDILHLGHVRYLQQARALGEALLVGINSDQSVAGLGKGSDRPVNPLEDRAEVLAALSCVDLVVPFGEPTPRRLIEQIAPDVLVKGGDWQPENIVGGDWVAARGGKVLCLPLTPDRSTTRLLERIRAG